MDRISVSISAGEASQLIAALRYWQRSTPGPLAPEVDVATDGGTHAPMDDEAIDALVERIQSGGVSAAQLLVSAYKAAEDGGSVRWEDLDLAHEFALKEVGDGGGDGGDGDCEECGAEIGDHHASLINSDHLESCSLHPSASK